MLESKFSLRSLAAKDKELIPEGVYDVVVDKAEFATSKVGASSNIIKVTYKITTGEFAGRVLFDNIGEKAYSFRLMPLLSACGVDLDREFSTAQEVYNFGINAIKGKPVRVEVIHREYNGKTYPNVKSVLAVSTSTTSSTEVDSLFSKNVDSLEGPASAPAPTIEAPKLDFTDSVNNEIAGTKAVDPKPAETDDTKKANDTDELPF